MFKSECSSSRAISQTSLYLHHLRSRTPTLHRWCPQAAGGSPGVRQGVGAPLGEMGLEPLCTEITAQRQTFYPSLILTDHQAGNSAHVRRLQHRCWALEGF